MPIIGTLCEFPLPEVIQLIGQRSGTLRVLDVPETPAVEIELTKGHLCSLRLGDNHLKETDELMKRLSVIIQSECGMFEFTETPGKEFKGDFHIPMNKLAMDLVFMVDEMNGITPVKKPIHKKKMTQSLEGGDSALRKKRKTSRMVFQDEDASMPESVD